MMKLLKIFSLLIIITSFIAACERKGNADYPNTPQIVYTYLSNDVINFTDTNSKVNVNFTLVDGDKDIGNGGVNADSALRVEEYRSDTLYRSYQLALPIIPRDYLINDYLKGYVLFTLPGVAFTPRTDSLHIRTRKDTLYMKFWVMDDAGNRSNVEQTDPIYIEE